MEVFNVKELATYLNCSISSIRKLVRTNQIPNFRIGSKLNFKKDLIDKWVYSQSMNNCSDEIKKEEVRI